MSSETCTNCGAEMIAGGRYCRRCGKPSSSFEPPSVTEAETQVFQKTAERDAGTQYHDPRPTGPSYLAPSESSAAPNQTAPIGAQQRLGRHGVLWGLALAVVVLLVVGFVFAVRWTTTSTTPVTVTKPETPPVTIVVPPVPPEVPQPPRPPDVKSGTLSNLKYPGSEVIMEMTRGGEGGMLQLKTTDSFEKVVAWYTAKLKPEKPITVAGTAVLKGDAATAVITDGEDGRQIVVKEGVDK